MNSSSQQTDGNPRRTRVVFLLLAIATVAAYFRVGRCGFVNYDDSYMITTNEHVHAGLTAQSLLWGLTTTFYEYWHPVTWWSHMLDWQLFGANPAGHHWMSLGLHVANTLLLFAVLNRMTGRMWPGAIAAALFGLHPLHVESVAWVAERKDLLSALFLLLSLWYYTRYVEARRPVVGETANTASQQKPRGLRLFYCLSLFCFALGLMSKPMVVTLPFVLLLLDFWPLKRNSVSGSRFAEPGNSGWPWSRLVLEKVPFLALSLLSCGLTYFGVKMAGDIISGGKMPLGLRLANIPVAYARYLWKTIYPADLAVLYPMPDHWPAWQVLVSILLLVAISAVLFGLRRSAPYLICGWLIFLGVLFPTVGIVPVGIQSIADRYMYLPSIGIFVAVAWGVADLFRKWKLPEVVLTGLTVLVLAACGWLTWAQTGHWRDSRSLWTHCLQAATESRAAHYNLAAAYADLGQNDAAINEFRSSLRLNPDHVEANFYLGVVLMANGQAREATNCFAKVLRLRPGDANARVNLALAQANLGNFDEALAECDRALASDPRAFAALTGRGRILSLHGRSDDAVNSYLAALRVNPNDYDTQYFLAVEYLRQNKLAEAIPVLRAAEELNPTSPLVHFQLGVALGMGRLTGEAAPEYREALRLRPDWPEALNNLAWILATEADENRRDGPGAVRLAARACEQTAWQQTRYAGTLAVAYAEAGQFDQAVAMAQKTCDLAAARGETTLARNTQVLLELFRNHKAYHEPK